MKNIDAIRSELFEGVRVFTLSDALLGFKDSDHVGLVPMVYAFDESYGPIELSERVRILPGEYSLVPEERPYINDFRQSMANNAKMNPHVGYYNLSYEKWKKVNVGTIFSFQYGGDYEDHQEFVYIVEKREKGYEFVPLTGSDAIKKDRKPWVFESENLSDFGKDSAEIGMVYIYKRLPDSWLKDTLRTLRELHQ